MAQFKALLASRAISKAVRRALLTEMPSLEKELKEVVENQIDIAFDPINSPEVDSMINGRGFASLRAELGLLQPQRKIDSMKRDIVASVRAQRTVAAGRKLARLNVNFTPDIRALAGQSWASQNNNGRNGPARLPWFKWMTQDGITPTIKRGWDTFYASDRGPAASFSRTRTNTIMRKNKRGRTWRVQVNFAGVIDNNFITRALNKRLIAIRRQTDISLKAYLNRVRRRLR